MTAKVITDPSALGWKFDSATGRWEWVAEDFNDEELGDE